MRLASPTQGTPITSESEPHLSASLWNLSSRSVMGVAMTRMRPCRGASVAGLSAGSTPTMGSSPYSARSVCAAALVAVLHAMTMHLAPSATKSSTIARESPSTSGAVFSP